MAKKKATSSNEPGSFSKLNDLLNKIAPDGEILDINPIAKIDEWISTGSYILNAALSGSIFGGLPNRRSLVLAGEEGTGKTFIAMSIVRNAQKMGYTPIYFDSEGSIDIDFVKKLGVDTSNIRLQPVNTVEEFSHIAAQITKNFDDLKAKGENPPKVMVVLDSLGNLTSEKEKEDTTKGDNKRDMTKQQAIRKLFRVNGLQFAKHGIPFIINNHVYACIFGDAKVKMGDGSFKNINKIQKNENVYTLAGPKKVIETFEYNVPNHIELIFEDDYMIKCTDKHKFGIESENGEIIWKTADEIEENEEIIQMW